MMKIVDTKTGRGIGYLLVNLTAIQPLFPVFAAGIRPDNSKTQVITINGKPVVNIATPNGAGVSHNTYHDFNVGKEGAYLNNLSNNLSEGIKKEVVFKDAGITVKDNPNFANKKPASLIINEVTGTSRSELNGRLQVLGDKADLIIANPNGITCNGCNFRGSVNRSGDLSVTLTTGKPLLDNDGSLKALDVKGGQIVIGAQGLIKSPNVPGSHNMSTLQYDYVNIISRTAEIHGKLHADKGINLIQGSNNINYKTGAIQKIAGVGPAPTIALDTKALGGMYANRIRLLSTDKGVGVNIAKVTGSVDLNVEGKIRFLTLPNNDHNMLNELTIKSYNVDIPQGGKILADNATISTDYLDNRGEIIAKKNMRIFSNTVRNNGGLIKAGGMDGGSLWIQGNAAGKRGYILDNRNGRIETAERFNSHMNGNNANEDENWNIIIRMNTVKNAAILDPMVDNSLFYYSKSLHKKIRAELNEKSPKGQIVAGSHLYINGDVIDNYYGGKLQGKGDVILTGGTLFNRSHEFFNRVDESPAKVLLYDNTLNSQINAGRNLTADFRNGIQIINTVPQDDGLVRGVKRVANITAQNMTFNAPVINVQGILNANNTFTALSNNTISVSDSMIEAKNDINLTAVNNIHLNQTRLKSTNITALSREGDITAQTDTAQRYYILHHLKRNDNQTGITWYLPDSHWSTALTQSVGGFAASGNLDLTAGKAITLGSQEIDVKKNVSMMAGGDLRFNTTEGLMEAGNYRYVKPVRYDASTFYDNVLASTHKIKVTENVTLKAGKSLILPDVKINAGKDVDLIAGSDIIMSERAVSESLRKKRGYGPTNMYGETIERLNVLGRAVAGNHLLLHAGRNLELKGVKLSSGGNLDLQAGQHIRLPSLAYLADTGLNTGSRRTVRNVTQLSAGKKLSLVGGGDVLAEGSELRSGGMMSLLTKGKMEFTAGRNVNKEDYIDWSREKITQQNVLLTSGGDLNLTSDGSVLFQATDVESLGAMTIAARGGFLFAEAMQESSVYNATRKKKRLFGSKTVNETTTKTVNKVVDFSANGNISLLSRDDSVYQGSTWKAGKDVSLTSTAGRVILEAVRDAVFSQRISSSNGFYIKKTDSGYRTDEWKLPQVHLGGNLTIDAAKGITADIKTKGKQSLANAVKTLGNTSGLAWVKTLGNRNDVAWNQVQDAYTSWSHTEKSLNPVVGAILAIAVGAATSGTGLASWAGNALSGGASSVSGSIVYGMGSSGMSALVSKAAVSLVENQGNISKTLKDLGGKESVKAIVSSMVTGGALAGWDASLNLPVNANSSGLPTLSAGNWHTIAQRVVGQSLISSGTNTAMYGGSFKDKLKDSLLSNVGSQVHAELAHVIGDLAQYGYIGNTGKALSHAAVAAIATEIGQGNGKGAAAGTLAAQMAAITLGNHFHLGVDMEKSALISKVIGAVVGGLATNSASGVNSGASAAEIASRFNDALHDMVKDQITKWEIAKQFFDGDITKAELYLNGQSKGKLSGTIDGAQEAVTGLFDTILHPVDTVEGLYDLVVNYDKHYVRATVSASEWLDLYGYALEKDPQLAGEMIGHVGGKINGSLGASLVLGSAGTQLIKKAVALRYNRTPAKIAEINQKYVDILSPEAKLHILYGEKAGSGGHLYPGQPGKTAFPQNWTADKIVHEIGDIATSPKTQWYAQTGTGGKYTNKGIPAKWIAYDVRDGVRIKVVYQPATGKIITAYPDNAPVPNYQLVK